MSRRLLSALEVGAAVVAAVLIVVGLFAVMAMIPIAALIIGAENGSL